jgi:hypothetical protein
MMMIRDGNGCSELSGHFRSVGNPGELPTHLITEIISVQVHKFIACICVWKVI